MLSVLLSLLCAAQAETLPGIPLPFVVDDAGQWVLGDALPEEFVEAGVAPGWILKAVDGQDLSDPLRAQRQVAAGPAREIRLLFATPLPAPEDPTAEAPDIEEGPLPETILVIPRAPLTYVKDLGLLPWPEGFAPTPVGWVQTASGTPALTDRQGAAWALDAATGAQQSVPPEGLLPLSIPEVFWSLSTGTWVLDREGGLSVLTAEQARQQLTGATRLERFQGRAGDHLALPVAGGLSVMSVSWPQGTPALPSCAPGIPESCFVAGKTIEATLSDRAGGQKEALRLLELSCTGGVFRGCYDAVALADPAAADQAAACVQGTVSACHTIARDRLAREPERPGPLVMGLLEYACQVDAAGSLGERLRRLEDAGEGCMMLAGAYDRLALPDRALLSLDQACVLGRADACEESNKRRHQAFALRTVRECEDELVPIASSCVDLGQLLQEETISATSLDDFSAFLKGCTLGDEEGCILLGDYVDRWGIENWRVVQAESTLMAACETGEQRACLGAAHLLVRHEPRSEDYARALEVFWGSCQAGLASACVAGAKQRRIGKARKVDAPGKMEMWVTACALHSAPGCSGLGDRLSRSKKTWEDAFTAWTQACELGDPHACTEIGQLIEEKRRDPWPTDLTPADYLSRGCTNGDPEGCYWLAEDAIPRRGEPPESAYMLLETSCEGAYGQGCAALADIHLERKSSFDDELAAQHLDTACSSGHYDSCRVLGTMYLRGKGVERDRQQAKELADRFRFNARRRHLRLGAHIGFPYLAGVEGEAVVPIPVGPALSFSGAWSYTPYAGNALLFLKGEDVPDGNSSTLQYFDGVVRLYPNNKARGIYGGIGIHRLQASGGIIPRANLTRDGFSGRFGIYTENRGFFSRVEMGIGSYGWIDLNDFDADDSGIFPLIQPTFGLSFGAALF